MRVLSALRARFEVLDAGEERYGVEQSVAKLREAEKLQGSD